MRIEMNIDTMTLGNVIMTTFKARTATRTHLFHEIKICRKLIYSFRTVFLNPRAKTAFN